MVRSETLILLQSVSDFFCSSVVYAAPPDEMRSARWLGEQRGQLRLVEELEARLGAVLPPSYRQFLQIANGWHRLLSVTGRFFPCEEVGWLQNKTPEICDAWFEPYAESDVVVSDEEYARYGPEQDPAKLRYRYLPEALQISDEDAAVALLNPLVQTDEGEWEAWLLGKLYPGARRYRSFSEMMLRAHLRNLPDN